MPTVHPVVPDDTFRHFVERPGEPQCPQLAVVNIRGALFFGAVAHVEDALLENLENNPGQHFLLLRIEAALPPLDARHEIRHRHPERAAGDDLDLDGQLAGAEREEEPARHRHRHARHQGRSFHTHRHSLALSTATRSIRPSRRATSRPEAAAAATTTSAASR